MKKLMFAAAAAFCGTVSFAELASQNVVGYAQQTANATRNTMMTPNFLNVNSATGCKLSDLSVTGYEPPVWMEEDEYFEGGCAGGEFILSFLNNDGSFAARYYWIDNGEVPAGWYAKGDATAIEGGASSVTIPAGKGAWVIGTGKTLNIPAPEL